MTDQAAPPRKKSSVTTQVVDFEREGQRLDNWLLAQLRSIPRSAVYRLLRRGEVRVNGKRKKADYRVVAGDQIRIPPVDVAERNRAGVLSKSWRDTLDARCLHEDGRFVVIDKPSGWAVHGGSGINQGLIEALRAHTGNRHLELVHRLDRDTSGCVLIAKTRAALRIGHAAFRDKRAKKRYQVLVQGRWPTRGRRVGQALERYVTASGERRVRVAASGKDSLTEFEVLAATPAISRLAAFPVTGRTHQIRVHCLWQGHPVLGDRKYGGDELQARWRQQGVTRLCLHAERLRLYHEGASIVDVRAPVPEDFERVWEAQGC